MKAQPLKHKILLLSVFISFFIHSFSQNTFTQGYGSMNSEEGRTVHQTKDGGYIISGVTNSSGMGNYDLYLIKTDFSGNVQWSKTFGGAKSEHVPGHLPDMQITKDGGYIIAGQTSSFLSPMPPYNPTVDACFIKTDSLGKFIWCKYYGYTGYTEANVVKQISNGDYIVTGGKDSLLNLYFLRLNSVGDYVSGIVTNFGRNDVGYDVIETKDKKFIAVGYKEDILMNPFKSGILIAKADCPPVLGGCTPVWTRLYYEPGGSTTNASASSIVMASDGNYIVAGTYETAPGSPSMFIMKTDTMGLMLWFKLYSPRHKLKSLKLTKDKGFIVAGTIGTYSPSDVFMMKTDSLGNIQWARSYGGQNNTSDEGLSVEQTADGGYVAGGIYGNKNKDVYIIKTDSLGNSNCVNTSIAVTASVHTPAVMNPAYVVNGGIHGNDTIIKDVPCATTAHLSCHCYTMSTTAFKDTVICKGVSTTLSATSVPINGYAYAWNNGATSSSIIVSPTKTTSYFVSVVDSNACFDGDSVTIYVSTLSANAKDTSLCIGSSVPLTVSGGNFYSWSTGATTTSITVGPTVSGPHSYTVFVTDTIGCKDTAIVTVAVHPYPVAGVSNVTICQGNIATLNATGNPNGNFSWSTGASTSAITVSPSTTTTYSVIASILQCYDTATGTVTVNPLPNANAGSDITINYGGSTLLTASGGGSFSWSNGSSTSSITVNPLGTTTYTLFVTGANGCVNVATVTVYVSLNCSLYLPNAFSPNEDNENDFFQPYYIPVCVKSLSIMIYNRWGEKVFESNDVNFRWDGTFLGEPMNTQVFAYCLKVTYAENLGQNKILKGNVSLIR